MIRGSHRRGQVARHTGCFGDTWNLSIDERDIEAQLGLSLSHTQ